MLIRANVVVMLKKLVNFSQEDWFSQRNNDILDSDGWHGRLHELRNIFPNKFTELMRALICVSNLSRRNYSF